MKDADAEAPRPSAHSAQKSVDRRDHILLALRLVPSWRLSTGGWDDLAKMLAALEGALHTVDLAAFDKASDDLLAFGPYRDVTAVGDAVIEPAPPKIRERLNTLVHTLSEPLLDLAAPLERQHDSQRER